MPRAKAAGKAVPESDKELGAASPVDAAVTVETDNIEQVLQAGQVEQEKSITELAEETVASDGIVAGAEQPNGRAAALAALAGGSGLPTTPAPTGPVAPVQVAKKSGREQKWVDGTGLETERAVVVVGMFKSTLAGRTYFGYKGDVIEAPVPVVERGVELGALIKEL